MSALRIVLKIPGAAYAELVKELKQVPPRERAERVRFLAGVGMAFLKPTEGPSLPAGQAPEAPAQDVGFNRLRSKLREGLD